jgi:phage terminase large subunit GpA-like protein
MSAALDRLPPPMSPPRWLRLVRLNARARFRRSWSGWRPPTQMATREWADKRLQLPPEVNDEKPGQYRSDVTPWLWAIQDAADDPSIPEVNCMKSAQVAWTIGVVTAYVGKRIDVDPCPILIMFPTTQQAREYSDEKLSPIIDATPALRSKMDRRSRKSGNRATFKRFPGGFVKMVGSNSPSSVKSTSAPVNIVEEPDDTSRNVKGQGDSIEQFRHRQKTRRRGKFIIGGTPTLAGLSAIEFLYKGSDQRKLYIPCHHCNNEHVLSWDNVTWLKNAANAHEIYGIDQPETAAYACPHCGGLWNDYEKNQNVRRACLEDLAQPGRRWKAHAPFTGVAGFGYLSELYVHWPKSALTFLVRRYLQAKHEAERGEDEKLIAFYNSSLGLPYEYGGKKIDLEELAKRAIAYAEDTVPRGGLLLTFGVDVQHNRFAITIRAWGRGEESWLVYFGEIYAGESGGVNDRTDPVWIELEQKVFGAYQHASGREIRCAAGSIDSADGNTNDAVYGWVREMRRKYPGVQLMAARGAKDDADKEIFSLPKKIDHSSTTKAAKYGLLVYIVGTNKAKDLLLGGTGKRGRIHLTGDGPGRFHVYQGARADYWDQVAGSEIKAPLKGTKRLVWQVRSGRRNEGIDTEVLALHAARALKTHIATPAQWDDLEQQLLQGDLFTQEQAPAAEPAEAPASTKTASTPDPNIAAPAAPEPLPVQQPRTTSPRAGFVNRWRQGR